MCFWLVSLDLQLAVTEGLRDKELLWQVRQRLHLPFTLLGKGWLSSPWEGCAGLGESGGTQPYSQPAYKPVMTGGGRTQS